MRAQILLTEIRHDLNAYETELTSGVARGDFSLNKTGENLAAKMLNIAFGYSLQNLNKVEPNAQGVDLIDEKKKIVVQVSSSGTVEKLQGSLDRTAKTGRYKGFTFRFVLLAGKSQKLIEDYMRVSSKNPQKYVQYPEITFDIKNDVMTLSDLVDYHIGDENILRQFYSITSEWLGYSKNEVSDYQSDLADVVNVLAEYKSKGREISTNRKFAIINKIRRNNLESRGIAIRNVTKLIPTLTNIYRQSENLIISQKVAIVGFLVDKYQQSLELFQSEEQRFDYIKQEAITFSKRSENCKVKQLDRLSLCIMVIIAEAFEECKIFIHPDTK